MTKNSPQDMKRILRWSVALCLVLDVALAVFLMSPWSPSKAAGEDRLNELTVEYQTLVAKVTALDKLQSRIRTSQEQILQLQSTSMPEEREVSSTVLAEVHRVAQASQVRAEGMSFKPDVKAHEGLRKVDMQVMVTGNYNDVVQFINGLERSPVFFVIDGISASVGRSDLSMGGNSPAGTIRLLVSLETYVRAHGSGAGGEKA